MNEVALTKKDILINYRILLVDDRMENLLTLENVIEKEGRKIIKAASGNEALKIALSEKIDLILLDVQMPEMDGYEAMKEIRKKSAFKQLPIIAITAKAMQGDREKCIEAGASDYITKPVNIEQLISMMKAWLYK